jgi:hypothetical protein
MPSRANLVWRRAGVIPDESGALKEVYYSFYNHPKSKSGKTLTYAADRYGTYFNAYNVGQIKKNLIIWDAELKALWSKYLNDDGKTWRDGDAMKGRALQLQALLHAHIASGSEVGRTISALEATINVIHSVRGIGGVASDGDAYYDDAQDLYRDTDIPLSYDHIRLGAYKQVHPEFIRVAEWFLCGSSPLWSFEINTVVDIAESAFFEGGWRINRRAAALAYNDTKSGVIYNVFRSAAWFRDPPVEVEMYKGTEIKELMERIAEENGGDSDDDDEDGDEDGDDDSSDDGYGGGAGGYDGGGGDDGGDDDSDEDGDGDGDEKQETMGEDREEGPEILVIVSARSRTKLETLLKF